MPRTALLVGSISLFAACATGRAAQTPAFDAPVPANERRAELTVKVDLEPVSDCDERFGVELYRDRGVELMSWAGGDIYGQGCRERRVTIRYLPERIARESLLARMRRISRKVEVVQ
jgi:hypothetical protein